MCEADPGLRPPTLGDIVFEVIGDLYGPVDNRLDDDRAEWVEIINVSMNRLDLSDCSGLLMAPLSVHHWKN